ncbi:hypothetical protein IIB50_00340 [Patescibacteria group bacterium]|nr:hypothetical protein [Patescibacteria group bacterium]
MGNITQRKTTVFYILAVIFAFAFLSGVSYGSAQETGSAIGERERLIDKTEIDAARSLLRDRLKVQRLDVKSNLELQRTDFRNAIDIRKVEIRTLLEERSGENREELHLKLDEMRGDARVLFEQHRTDRTQLLRENRVERKKILEESHLEQRELIAERKKGLARERAHAYTERIINRFIAAFDRLDRLAERMQSRIDTLTNQGLDLSDALNKLDDARVEIAASYTVVGEIEATIVGILESDNPGEQLVDIRSQIGIGKDVLKSAHQSLVDAIRIIKAAGGVGNSDGNEPDESDDTNNTSTDTTE